MNNRIQALIAFLFLFTINSCNQSSLSYTGLKDLTAIHADIKIYQNLKNKNDNEVTVCLYDKDNDEIRNDSIKIFVNDNELEYTVHKGLYYTTTSNYNKENVITKNDNYYFEIALSNGKKYFLGEIETLHLLSDGAISYDEKGDINKDALVKWKDFVGVDLLVVSKSAKLKKMDNDNITYCNQEADDTIKINSRGNYIIPKSKLSDSKQKISTVSLKFTANKTGKVNTTLLKSSSISITGNIEKNISFE